MPSKLLVQESYDTLQFSFKEHEANVKNKTTRYRLKNKTETYL